MSATTAAPRAPRSSPPAGTCRRAGSSTRFGPIWNGGHDNEAALLASAYGSSLDRAAEAGARSVAFAAISCGIYGYPLEQAAAVSIGAVRSWLGSHPETEIEDIMWVLRGDAVMAAFRAHIREGEPE